MNDAEKRLQKLAQRDSVMFKRAETMGLQVDHAALELYIQKNFLNQAIDHQDVTTDQIAERKLPSASFASNADTAEDAANHVPPEALTS